MSRLTIFQKILLLVLFGLIILMIIFSLWSLKNHGEDGYISCVQKKCERSQAFCSKFRELYNCCLGAGGKMVVVDGKQICAFT